MSIKVMSHYWDHKRYMGNEKLTLLIIADNADDDGIVFISAEHIQDKIGCLLDEVEEILCQLENDGEIVMGPSKNNNSYYLTHYRLMDTKKPSASKEKTRQRGFVYLIHCPDAKRYKIGVSKNPPSRRDALQKQSPFKLTLIHAIETPDPYILENELHEAYYAKRVNGEWFDLNESDVEHIKGL